MVAASEVVARLGDYLADSRTVTTTAARSGTTNCPPLTVHNLQAGQESVRVEGAADFAFLPPLPGNPPTGGK